MPDSCAAHPCELIWDENLTGTAESPRGDLVQVGEAGAWTPDQMVSVAVQASLMVEFLRIAESTGLEVLGYLSSALADAPSGEKAGRVVISPCIVLALEHDVPRARDVLERARARSWICSLFGDAVDLDPSYFVAPAAAPA